MRLYLDCVPCFIRQALEAARGAGLDEDASRRLLERTLALAARLDWSLPPPLVGREIHRAVRELAGDPDPYLARKVRATEEALAVLPRVEERIRRSRRPFLEALRYSIAGNVIDLGAKAGPNADARAALEAACSARLDEEAAGRFEQAVRRASRILFIADNAGEIVLDRPLLERMGREKVTVAVRGGPVINDATLEDAERAGLAGRFRLLSSGSDTPGTWLPDCSEEFRRLFEEADLVVAKGQGNYETLSGAACDKVYFLLMAKCPVAAADLGVEVGCFVVAGGGGPRPREENVEVARK